MNHNKLKDYLATEKIKCEKEITDAHGMKDFSSMQYWIGRKHSLADTLRYVEGMENWERSENKEDSKHERN